MAGEWRRINKMWDMLTFVFLWDIQMTAQYVVGYSPRAQTLNEWKKQSR